jgi:misacylated tRNA(Ala) deacylase
LPPETYLLDAYRTRLTTRVAGLGPGGLRFDDTVFHPSGGGQPGDSGRLRGPGGTWTVDDTVAGEAGVEHHLAPSDAGPPTAGEAVELELDWPRRYRFMRYHTALHLLSGVVFRRFTTGITGNQIAEDRARVDFSLPEFSKRLAEELLEETNVVATRGLPVEVRFLGPEEFAEHPELVRVAAGKLGSGGQARLIDIVGFDAQADGGTHVRSTAEVGTLRLDRIENKGARNKRLYVTLDTREPPTAP